MVFRVKELPSKGLYASGRGSKPPAGQTREGRPRTSVREEKPALRD